MFIAAFGFGTFLAGLVGRLHTDASIPIIPFVHVVQHVLASIPIIPF